MSKLANVAGHRELYQLFKMVRMPEFVKSAQLGTFDQDALAALPSSAFADRIGRRFPCHTKAAAFTSALQFDLQRDQLPPETRARCEAFLNKVASFYSIAGELEAARQELNERTKSAAIEDDDFALLVKSADGSLMRLMALQTPDDVQSSAAYLRRYIDRFPLDWRRKAAKRIVARAVSTKTELSDPYPWCAAGIDPAHPRDMANDLWERSAALHHSHTALRSGLNKLATALSKLNRADGELSEKVAALVDDIDTRGGLISKYFVTLQPPEMLAWRHTLPLAKIATAGVITTQSGDVYSLSQLKDAGLATYAALGPDIAESVTSDYNTVDAEKAAAVVRSLPFPDAVKFRDLMLLTGQLDKRAFAWDSVKRRSLATLTKQDWQNMMQDLGCKVDDMNWSIVAEMPKKPAHAHSDFISRDKS